MTGVYKISDQSEVFEPMEANHFNQSVSQMRLKNEQLIEACRQVLVEGRKNKEMELAFDLKQNRLSETCSNIVKKWEEICAKEGLVCRPVVLQPHEMAAISILEKDNLDRMASKKKKR